MLPTLPLCQAGDTSPTEISRACGSSRWTGEPRMETQLRSMCVTSWKPQLWSCPMEITGDSVRLTTGSLTVMEK